MDANQVYKTLEEECEGFDAIYEDYIIHVVGSDGLNTLIEKCLIESCGVINGRKLYTLL